MNLLVLDEPTNHLDLPAIEQLEEALESYDGALLLVTHDRRLLENVRLDARWNVDNGVTELWATPPRKQQHMSMDRVAWSSLYNITRLERLEAVLEGDAQAGVQLRQPAQGQADRLRAAVDRDGRAGRRHPVLAGQVVDAIIAGAATDVVVWLAVLIAIVAVAEAGLGLVTRWLSSTIGEGVIVDLRTRSSTTCRRCRSRSSPAPAPGRW